jgi:hypothetical protein
MSDNKKYIQKKFKVLFGNMKSPTMYAELYNGKYTKTYQNENNEIVSAFITKDEYAAALGHILLRPDGYKWFENKDNNNTDIAI